MLPKKLLILCCAFSACVPLSFYEICDAQTVQSQKVNAVVEVSALEDLMREHGLLNRILLIYQEIIKRLENGQTIAASTIHEVAELVRTFIEDYHEKLEEEYIFPRFKKAKVLTDTINILLEQHQAGRRLTDTVSNATQSNAILVQNKKKILEAIKAFIKMYRVHEAWEDTIVFPQFHALITSQEYEKLGDIFEEREEKLFGKNGFEAVLQKVILLEKRLGIYGLSRVTPH